ncbi:MAG: hypothetical protein WA547_08895, partial [Thermoplasmata archaeon]
PAPAPPYLETADDVAGMPPPAPTPAPAVPAAVVVAGGAAVGAGAGAVAADADEPDIDSLMAELDKISGEILKRPKNAAAKKPPANP